MDLVFALIVIVAGEPVNPPEQAPLFSSVLTCNYYAKQIERQQHKITAFCEPRKVRRGTPRIWQQVSKKPEANDQITFAMKHRTGVVIKVNDDGTVLVKPYSEPMLVYPSQIVERKS